MKDKTSMKRLKISHYGPLKDVDIELEEGLNAFYGSNESGKTLMVEALMKMLADDAVDRGRIDQDPNGFLTVETQDGEFDAGQQQLKDLFGDLEPSDLRNSLAVRDEDLRRPDKANDFGKNSYFNDVTDRVLGSMTSKIEDVRDSISDLAFLTNSTADAKLENRKETGKLRDKKQRAETLLEEIEEFRAEVEAEGLYQSYSRLDQLEKEIESKDERKSRLENAKKQKKHEKGKQLLEKLREAEREEKELERRKKELEELKNIRKEAENFEEEIADASTLKKASTGSALLSGLSVIAAVLNPSPIFILASLIFLSASAYAFSRMYKASQAEKENERRKEEIIEKAKARDVEAETLPEVIDAVEKRKEELKREEEDNQEKKIQAREGLRARFGGDHETSEEWNQELRAFSNSYENVEVEYTEGDLEELEEKLEGLEDERDSIRNEIQQYSEILDKFDSGVKQALDERFVDFEEKGIQTVQDLDRASRQLEEFISNLEQNVEASTKALEILEELEQKEQAEFDRIFTGDSYAVKMFQEATGGNYEDINYSKASGELRVKRSDGKEIKPEKLSQGTYDLLYIAVRLQLAREIFKGSGFLILDNAFAHSDIGRIKQEIEFLKELEREGWQIIYLTYREDVRDALETETEVRQLEDLRYEK